MKSNKELKINLNLKIHNKESNLKINIINYINSKDIILLAYLWKNE